MTQLKTDAAIVRFGENEERVNKFVNELGFYLANTGFSVETLPSFMERMVSTYLSFSIKGDWLTATNYVRQDLTNQGGIVYICLVDHASTVFATDLASGKWAVYQGITKSELSAANGTDFVGGVGRCVNSIAELKALSKLGTPKAFVFGYYEKGDGGGGDYYYDSSDVTTADNGGSIIVAADGGRWKLRNAKSVNIRQFGGKGDGTHDDTNAWKNGLKFAVENSLLFLLDDGCFVVNDKLVLDADETYFVQIRIQGTARVCGPASRYQPTKTGTTILTNNGGALEAWFKKFYNESIDVRGINFVDTATYTSLGRAATPAIKVKKGNPPSTEGRYSTNNNFIDISAAGYADPIVFQGMFPNSSPYTADWNFFGPTHFVRYYPYECGSGLVLANCTMNRLRVSESLWFGLSLGGLVLRKDGDLAAGTGTGGIVYAAFDMVHMEGVSGCFRIPTGLEALGKSVITLIDFTREFCGIYGPTGPGGFYQGDPLGIASPCKLNILGRFDKDEAYGEMSRIHLPENSEISSQALVNVNFENKKVLILTPETVNAIDETFTLNAGSTLAKTIRVAEGAAIDFNADIEIEIATGGYGVKTIKTYGRTGGVRYRDVSGSLGSGITATFTDGGTSDMVGISILNETVYNMDVRIKMKTQRSHQSYFV